jgi:hypothetical protein
MTARGWSSGSKEKRSVLSETRHMENTSENRLSGIISLLDEILSMFSSFKESIVQGVLEEKFDKLIMELQGLASEINVYVERQRLMYTVERVILLKTYAGALRHNMLSGRLRGFTKARDDMIKEILSIRSYLILLSRNIG